MRVLIACERSGIVRDAFLRRGHIAISCDIVPTDTPGPHIQDDVLDHLDDGWDMMIAHPPCTYVANSGVRWLYEIPGRWKQMEDGAHFIRRLLDADIPYIALENPIPHKYALQIIGRKYDQIIQPWQFGHGETKATCLWLKALMPLEPTDIVSGRDARIHKMGPSVNRGALRSISYPGIANAMSAQWGDSNPDLSTVPVPEDAERQGENNERI